MQELSQNSILTVEMAGKITMTGVASVDSFSDTLLSVTVGGKKVKIEGARLKILSFSQGSGNFVASGEVHAVKYGAKLSVSKLFR